MLKNSTRKLLFASLLLSATAWGAMPFGSAVSSGAAVSGLITSKTGAQNARTWIVTMTNNGSATANNVTMNSFTLTQVAGAACTPIVTPPAGFPFSMGNIAPGSSANAFMTIDFTGCSASSRFTVNFRFVANFGAIQGSKTLYNQFQ